jgi:hypothetical protein
VPRDMKDETVQEIRLVCPQINRDLFWIEPIGYVVQAHDSAKPFNPLEQTVRAHFEIVYAASNVKPDRRSVYSGASFGIKEERGVCPVNPNDDASLAQCVAWLRERGVLKDLFIESPTGQQQWLPHLRPIWNQMKDLTIEGAQTFLNDELYERRTTAEFGGITFDGTAISFVAPLGTIGCLFYLGVYVRQLARYIQREETKYEAFAWIAVFGDPLSRILTCASVTLLPIFVNVWLLKSTHARHFTMPQLEAISSWALIGGVCVASAFAAFEFRQLAQTVAVVSERKTQQSATTHGL